MSRPITPNELARFFQNATKDVLAVNSGLAPKIEVSNTHSRTLAKLERSVRDEPLATPFFKKEAIGRVLVSVKSFRKRLLDEDGLCEKYHVDLCRYSGIIPSDAPGKAKIEVSQEKIGSKDIEEIIITIEQL